MNIKRRSFLKALTFSPLLASVGCQSNLNTRSMKPQRFMFTSQGKTGIMNADGTGLRYLDLDVPKQVTWQPTGFFPDG